MQFLSRVFGTAPKASRVRQADRSPRSRCSQISVESLEGRDLMSGGIAVYGGAVQITATQYANNTVTVSNLPDGNVGVNLNGNVQEFSRGSIWTICYNGGAGGNDKFSDDTNLTDSVVMPGNNNSVSGGSSWNTCYFYGSNNSFNGQNAAGYVFTYNSTGNSFTQSSNVTVHNYQLFRWW